MNGIIGIIGIIVAFAVGGLAGCLLSFRVAVVRAVRRAIDDGVQREMIRQAEVIRGRAAQQMAKDIVSGKLHIDIDPSITEDELRRMIDRVNALPLVHPSCRDQQTVPAQSEEWWSMEKMINDPNFRYKY